jgi:signal transduction histidine kinase
VDKPGPLGEVEARRGEVILGSYETISRKVDTDGGELTLTAAVPVDQLADTVDTLRRGLTIGLPALIAVVAALAWVLVGRALRPVEAIRTEVDAITGSTMHRRVPVPPTGDEIGRLARTMNAMLGRLDAAATRQRQFVSDASHELRSPVAALRTCLEVAGRHPDRTDWPAVVGTALAEESRLEALLDDLLLLAAHDEGAGTAPEAGAVDVAAIVEAEAARPRRVPVEVRPPAGPGTGPPGEAGGAPVVRGDADRLARALANLVDNAARYATDTVRVTVGRHDDALRVTVDDDGPGIPAADRERVFERFTRLDDGRARPEGGTGLGLAVVRSIVDQHHGRVWAEGSPVGGARLVVELPVLVGQGATGPPRR